MTRQFLFFVALLTSVTAFLAPVPATGRVIGKSQIQLSESSTAADPFDTYELNNPAQALAIRDVAVGSGDVIQKDDLIKIKYTGRLMANEKEFESSTVRIMVGEPDRVMRGWSQGIEGMRIGGKRTLRIPPRLGYGARGAGNVIPGNADLEFDVEIVEKEDGPLAAFSYKTGLGLNVKTGGMAFFLGFLALGPFIEKLLS